MYTRIGEILQGSGDFDFVSCRGRELIILPMKIRLQFLLSLTPFLIFIFLIGLDVLSYVSGQVYLTL
jgi:hypothetical protein